MDVTNVTGMPHDDVRWRSYQEPFVTTLARTGSIAVAVGALIAYRQGGLVDWPIATLLLLWPSLGGHWVELLFLNFPRPRLPVTRSVQIGVWILVWFIGGMGLAAGMKLTAVMLGEFRPWHWPAW
jgi:hypothetical protein